MDKHTININVPKGCQARTTVAPMKLLKDMSYLRMFSDGLYEIVQDREMNLTDIRVLLYLYSVIDFENKLCKSQAEIGKALGMVRQEVWKSIKKLIEKNYISISGKIARQNIYTLNPRIGFRSRAINLSKLSENWDELILEEQAIEDR